MARKKKVIDKMYYAERLLGYKEVSEIDMDLYAELFGNNWDDNDDHPTCVKTFTGDNYPISIDRMIDILTKIKKTYNVTHVSINYHVDHIGYMIYGLNIGKATEKEIEDWKRMEEHNKNIEKEMDVLRKKYAELEKKILRIEA